MMPIIDRSYYDAAQKGRNDSQNEQLNVLRQQGMQQNLAQGNLLNQRNAEADKAAQAQKFAQQMHIAIQYAQGSKTPKAMLEQNFPELVQMYGPDWQTATDDQVRAELDNAAAKFGVAAGIGPAPAPKQYTTQKGPRGSLIQVDPTTGEQKQIVGPDNSQPAIPNGSKYRPLTQDEYKQYGLPAGTTAQIDTTTGKIDLINKPNAASVGRPLPPVITKGLIENNSSIRKIDNALAALEKYPAAFGMGNYMGDSVRQRTDPKGVDARAKVADIGSLIIHDRSGAAVSASEFPRLAPFIPQATDDPRTVKTKLENLKANIQMIQEETQQIYSTDQGYKEFNAAPIQQISTVVTTPQAPVQIKSDAEYSALPSGTQYIAPDGSTRTKR